MLVWVGGCRLGCRWASVGLGGLCGGLGLVFGGSGAAGGGRAVAAGQAMAQLVPLWCRPRLTSRVRLTAAARSLSQCRFFAVPL